MKIVAFGHRQGVGKDTAARILTSIIKSQNSRVKVGRLALADSLKEACESLFGWAGLASIDFYENRPEFKERVLPAIDHTPRQIWLKVGKVVQEIAPKALAEVLVQRADLYDIVIIPDLRKRPEAEFLQGLNAFLVKITRDVPRLEDNPDAPYNTLDAELENWPHWWRVLDNNGDRRALNDQLIPLARELLT